MGAGGGGAEVGALAGAAATGAGATTGAATIAGEGAEGESFVMFAAAGLFGSDAMAAAGADGAVGAVDAVGAAGAVASAAGARLPAPVPDVGVRRGGAAATVVEAEGVLEGRAWASASSENLSAAARVRWKPAP